MLPTFFRNCKIVNVTQIKHISRNQLHSAANFYFGLMGKKTKHCWALSTNLLVQCSCFSWSCFASCWIGTQNPNLFKIVVWRCDFMKRNYGGCTFKILTCVQLMIRVAQLPIFGSFNFMIIFNLTSLTCSYFSVRMISINLHSRIISNTVQNAIFREENEQASDFLSPKWFLRHPL